jgi:inner membrane protein
MAFVQPTGGERSPARKLLLVLLVGFLLTMPLFSIYLLNYDRQSKSQTARASIAEGWGGPQTIAGPLLIIPYQAETTETVSEGGKEVTKTRTIWRELTLAPEVVAIDTKIKPSVRNRSIYQAVVYESSLSGTARFALPIDLSQYGIVANSLALDRAELRFGVSDARGLVGKQRVTVNGAPTVLQPGNGLPATGGSGFYARIDARQLVGKPIATVFDYSFRGNAALTLSPRGAETAWDVTSSWPDPSFQGGFLPATRIVSAKGFSATYRISNIALGQSLVETSDARPVASRTVSSSDGTYLQPDPIASSPGVYIARVDLIQPVDLYDQVERATKYGFLFIGFTFIAFLMFDVIGGVRVSTVEYLLVGVALILFFVLLLAFAEVIGFTFAYVVASAAIIGLISAYSASVLKSWRRANYVGTLLIALYAVLYILLSLEAYSLLIGSLMLFLALAGVMYATRNLDWGARQEEAVSA